MKHVILTVLALFSFTFAALAADVSGKWTAQLPGRGGTQTTTFMFNSDGSNLTGTVETPRGANPISEGKVDGDTISFVENLNLNGNAVKITYTGKINGNTIAFTREGGGGGRRGGGRATSFTATKAN